MADMGSTDPKKDLNRARGTSSPDGGITNQDRGLSGSKPDLGAPELPRPPAQAKEVVFFAAGFDYTSEANELIAVRNGVRQSTSKDLDAVAKITSPSSSYGVNSFAALWQKLASIPGPISRVYVVGHGAQDILAFSGTLKVTSDDVEFDSDFALTREGLKLSIWNSTKPTILAKFTKDAQVILVGCRAASGGVSGLVQEVADFFGLVTKGFHFTIRTCLSLTSNRNALIGIKERGWIKCSGKTKDEGTKPCDQAGFVRNLRLLNPDYERAPRKSNQTSP